MGGPIPIKFIFIVSAHPLQSPSGTFVAAAEARTVELCQRFYLQRSKPGAVLPAPAVLQFLHFDCEHKTINVFDFPLLTTAKPRPPTVAELQRKWTALADLPASGDPSSPTTFVDSSLDTHGRFTILNIYHSIRGAPPESVLELSIFGHGWPEGPVIHNTGDCPLPSPPTINGLPIRLPDDADGRARTDFEDNMGENPNLGKPPGQFPRTGGKDALKEFKAAFDPQASFIVFGCNGQDPVRNPTNNCLDARLKSSAEQVIHQAYVLTIAAREAKKNNLAATIGKDLAAGKVPADPVPIDMGAEFDEERHDIDGGNTAYDKFFNDKALDKEARKQKHYRLDAAFFPAATSAELKFNRPWSSILGFVARRTQQTYAFKAASKLGIDVLGGPTGTLSSVGKKDRQQLVCGEFRGSRCTRIVHFHEVFMRTDPSRKSERRYFVYDARTVAHINTLAQNP
jgi:hypothetical protein